MNLEILVEERSAEQALHLLPPRIVSSVDFFDVHPFQGKPDLLKQLPHRLKGYATWITQGNTKTSLVVLVDRDNDNCLKLKAEMEKMAVDAGLSTATTSTGSHRVHVLSFQVFRDGVRQLVAGGISATQD